MNYKKLSQRDLIEENENLHRRLAELEVILLEYENMKKGIPLHEESSSVEEKMGEQVIPTAYRELQEANRKLQLSEERLELALWGADEGLWDWNIETGHVYYSDRWIEMLGYRSEEIQAHIGTWENAVHPDDILQVQEALNLHFEGKTPCYETEHRLKHKSGNWIWVLDRGKVVSWDENGRPLRIVGTKRDITDNKINEEKIRYLSFNDSLTGVYNRAFFNEEIQRLNAARQMPLSIIMGDLNGLKLLNDAFGHYEGDKLLVTIASILKNCCREEDIVARWGGDEFVILLPRTGVAESEKICTRIKKACQKAGVDPIKPSIALGTATKERAEEDVFKVLREAENIMYRNKLLESKSTRNSIIASLEVTLPERTGESREHARRLKELSMKMAQALGLIENDVDRLGILTNLHDIGKVGIPAEILSKPGPLLADEWEMIKKHPEIGFRIIQSSPEFPAIAEEILAHHERWDGTGYPKGLKGDEIPLLSRILSIVDAYDVMTNNRLYKKAMTHAEALKELQRCSGTQFDPELVEVFLRLYSE